MQKTIQRSGIWVSASLTSWFPWGPHEAYCSTAFSLSGGLSSTRSLEHTQKLRYKLTTRDDCLIWSLLRFVRALPLRKMLHCEDERARCREGKQNRKRGLFHARVQHLFIYTSSHTSFTSSVQANIFLQGTLRQWALLQVFLKSVSQSLLRSSRDHPQLPLSFSSDDAEYESQAVKSEVVQYKP